MWPFNIFKKKKKPKVRFDAKITINEEIDEIYLKKLECGLFPGEIVLLDWLDGKAVDTKFPGYFEYTYGIDAKKSSTKLIENEFLISAPPEVALMSLKVTELKEILKDRNLKVSGKKNELVKRLNESLSDEEILKYITKQPLVISSKGKLLLDEYYYVVPAHKYSSKDGVYSVASAIHFMNTHNLNFTPTSRDISWALYQQDYLKNHQNQMYGLARNNLLSMAKQIQHEDKLEYALKLYLDVCIMDLSGLANNGRLDGPDLTSLAIGITDEIKHILNKQNINKNKLKEIYDESWSNTRQSIPFHYLYKEECYQCIEHAINDENNLIYEILKNKFDELDKEKFEDTYNLKLPISDRFD